MSEERSKKPTSTKEIRRMDVRLGCTIWTDSLEFRVTSIDLAESAPFGYCQFIVCTLNGDPVEMNYYFDDMMGAIDLNETGDQWYKIRYDIEAGLYECKPTKARPKENLNAPVGENKWDKINLGKCRHGILCSAIESDGLHKVVKNTKECRLDEEVLAVINKLAQFSMTGEIE